MHARQLLALALAASAAAAPADLRAQQPDLILHGGKVVTVDDSFSIAQAIAVAGDRILAVGTDAEIRALAGDRTEQVDLEGRTVIPGLIDSHVHPTGASMYEFDHPVPAMETIADVLAYIAGRAEALEDGEWIVVSQVFITRLRDQRFPNRRELDRVAPRNPVYFRTGPDAALNSLALELSGIDKDFQVTDGLSGYIERDPQTGEPTGILRNLSRYVKSESSGRSASAEDRKQRLKALLADYNSVGITGISDRSAGKGDLEIYQALREAGDLSCRVFLYYRLDANQPLDQVEAEVKQLASHPLHDYNPQLWLRGVKVFLDGGMLTGSAYMREPWGKSEIYSIDDPNYRGLLFIQPEQLYEVAKLVLAHDLQMTAHSVGDGAVQTLVDAYAAINEEFPVREHRPCITHCNFMSAEAIAKMKDLGIVADLQPAWLWLDGATLLRQFGQERMTWFQPYRTLFDEGVVVGGGSDHMQRIDSLKSTNPYNPFLGMWIAVTRQPRWMDEPLHPEQRITREEALRLYTINNAYLTFEEQEKGSLEKGKLADLVVLDQDLLTCPQDAIKDITVHATYLGGRQVYPARAAD